MSGWVMLGLLTTVLAWLAWRAVRRRYQNFRIRQHKHAIAWREYLNSRRGRPRW